MPPQPAASGFAQRRVHLRLVTVGLLTAVVVASIGTAKAAANAPPAGAYAWDSFSRSLTSGWGMAEVGGAFTTLGPAGSYSVRNNVGVMTLANSAGVGRGAVLASVSQRDVDLTVRLRLDKLPVSGEAWFYAVARRTGPNDEYRARIRLKPSGVVWLGASRVVGGNESPIGTAVGLSTAYTAGAQWVLRATFTGASPTTIKASAWPSGASTPASWLFSTADSSSGLQQAGGSGLRVYASGSNAPFSAEFDDYQLVSAAGSATPTPSPTPAPTPSPTAAITSPGYYVSPTGKDSNSGILAAPWRTLQKAADTVPAGATVYLRGGTHGPFVMRRSGTSSAPITFTAYGTEKPIVDGYKNVQYAIKIVGAKHVRVSKLTIRGGFAHEYSGAGITAESSAHIEIRNNVIIDNKAWGVRSFNSTSVTLAANAITQKAVGGQVGRAGEGTKVTNNDVHHNNKMIVNTSGINGDDVGGEGVAIVMTTGTVTVSGNRVWGNRASSHDYGYDGGAFSIYGASNWVITNNVTWNNRNVLETGTDANKTQCKNGKFTRNVNYGATTVDVSVGMTLRCASYTLVSNNTFEGTQRFVFDISHNKGSWGGSVEGLQIVNNIISVSTGKIYGIETDPLPNSVVINYNLVYNSGTGYLATVVGRGTRDLATLRSWTGLEANGIQADPRFVDAAGHDYRLRADSPAVDSGRQVAGVTEGYAGSAPDRGAIERR
jgi:hypothetical protein